MNKDKKCGLKRESSDKFYTNTDIVNICLKLFSDNIKIDVNDLVIEPSAGNGAFSVPLSKLYKNITSYDILPENDIIIKQDYLKLETPKCDGKIHVIGNPPFGRQSTMAKQFITKSSKFAHSISFVLPKSFKKDSFIKVFPLKYHMIICEDLPQNSFNIDGKIYDVPCVFQIWIKKDDDRIIPTIYSIPQYMSYIKKDNSPDFSIRRVGVYAGKVNKNFTNDSEQSHYFIKLNGVKVDDFIKKYNEIIKFSHDNTVGPKSLSVQELNRALTGLF